MKQTPEQTKRYLHGNFLLNGDKFSFIKDCCKDMNISEQMAAIFWLYERELNNNKEKR